MVLKTQHTQCIGVHIDTHIDILIALGLNWELTIVDCACFFSSEFADLAFVTMIYPESEHDWLENPA